MPLAPGHRVGPFEVEALIGVGGMGEVYRARDTSLGRTVALKTLPATFAGDAERLARFEREAHVLASLNHPHIAQVYGFERGAAGAPPCLVMELVAGDDLSVVVARGRLAPAEALPIAAQVADALEAAHERGVIHRDLKPANIKLTPDGSVKVLDFGLAKALDPAAVSGTAVTDSPTLTNRATQLGTILGTAAYMAPEQARGKPVDRRADIWAFGLILFELLSGRRAFDGDDVTEVLARVIERDADWSLLPPTPPGVRRLLERCLAKDPRQRLRDIGEARIAIAGALLAPQAAVPEPGAPPRRRAVLAPFVPWLVAAVFGVAAIGFALAPAAPDASASRLHAELTLPPGVEVFFVVALSPDGRQAAFIGVNQSIREIYVRSLDSATWTPIRGTETVSTFAFSPDGRTIAFVTADGQLKTVVIAGGLVNTLAHADFLTGVAWLDDDTIVLGRQGGLWTMPARGGDAVELTALDRARGEVGHRIPSVLPDGRGVLYSVVSADGIARIEAVTLPDRVRRPVADNGISAHYLASGHLLIIREGSVFAVPFDPASLEMRGQPVRVLDDVAISATRAASAAVSTNGSLLYSSNSATFGQLVWVSQGAERPAGGPPRAYFTPRVSPDGRRLAFADSAIGHIWILDLEREAFVRLTDNRTWGSGYPVWLPDGRRLVARGPAGVMVINADGEGAPVPVPGSLTTDFPSGVSPDGRTLLVVRLSPETSGDVYALPIEGGEPRALLATRAYEGGPQYSPDGRWLVYSSDVSGRMEVFVRPLDGTDRRWQVSTGGGASPMWNPNGSEIFYRSGNQLLAVSVALGSDVRLSSPRRVLEQRYAFGPTVTIANYSLHPNGRDFLFVKEVAGASHLNLVVNWFEELRARVPTR